MQKKVFGKYNVVAVTDTGLVRAHNEDNILIDDELGLLLVADGMGGHQAGEVASMEAVKVIQQMIRLLQKNLKKPFGLLGLFGNQKLDTKDHQAIVKKSLHEANHHVYQLNLERNADNGSGMGTTIAGCWLVSDETMLVFHIGDSRVYRVRQQKLQALTKDHSILQAWHDNGCEGDKPQSNVILRAVGPFSETEPEVQVIAIEQGDSFLICSDGLTDMLDDEIIESALQEVSVKPLERCTQDLLQLALEQGGRDNVSIILLASTH